MKNYRFDAGARVIIGCALAVGMLLFPSPSSAQIDGPLPPIKQPPNIVPLTPVEQLGKDIVFDITLSNPTGYACFTCHTPETGHASPGPPDGSEVNAFFGIPSGVVPGRATNRKPMTYAMTAFCPIGPFYDADAGVYIGGTFWDGRTPDEPHQATQPFIDANEMANLSSNGIQDPVAGGYSALVVKKVQSRPYTPLFKKVYGPDVFTKYTTQQIYMIITEAIGAYEASAEINPFNSKYDASKYGTPPQNLYTLSASEERGQDSVRGRTESVQRPELRHCPMLPMPLVRALNPILQPELDGKEAFTMYCFANIGVPKNPNNPYYENTDPVANPFGYNPLGTNYIDYGLGANPNPAPDGTVFYNDEAGRHPPVPGAVQGARACATRTSGRTRRS